MAASRNNCIMWAGGQVCRCAGVQACRCKTVCMLIICFLSHTYTHMYNNLTYEILQDIKRHDQGIYRCRVDFRTAQTQSFRFNLSVISEYPKCAPIPIHIQYTYTYTYQLLLLLFLVLPEQPIILDRWGRQLNGTQLGPKQEGDDIVITCRVVGGK